MFRLICDKPAEEDSVIPVDSIRGTAEPGKFWSDVQIIYRI